MHPLRVRILLVGFYALIFFGCGWVVVVLVAHTYELVQQEEMGEFSAMACFALLLCVGMIAALNRAISVLDRPGPTPWKVFPDFLTAMVSMVGSALVFKALPEEESRFSFIVVPDMALFLYGIAVVVESIREMRKLRRLRAMRPS